MSPLARRLVCLAVLVHGPIGAPATAATSLVEPVGRGVLLVRDESGSWGGPTQGMTHQRGGQYQVKKVLDLSAVPPEAWKDVGEVRLSAYLAARDYSAVEQSKGNGLDEAVIIEVNGKAIRVPTAELPVWHERQSPSLSMGWFDRTVPKELLRRGPNEFVFRLDPGQKQRPDDYLYLGIDNSAARGNSAVKLDAKAPWRTDRLNSPGATGEYMVRLYLIRGSRRFAQSWRPGEALAPGGDLLYAGNHAATWRIEWDALRLDPLEPLEVDVELADPRPVRFQWLDAAGEPVKPEVRMAGPRFRQRLDGPRALRPSGIAIEKAARLSRVELIASRSYHPRKPPIDIAPPIAPPRAAPADAAAQCTVTAQAATLVAGTVNCRFELNDGRLRLASLHNPFAAVEMARSPASPLFLVEVGGDAARLRRLAGSADFRCRALSATPGRQGFDATLVAEDVGLEARLSAWVETDLHLSLRLKNVGPQPLDFKVAFPVLSGLAIDEDPAGDYYFYPLGGGVIADAAAIIRQGYGDHQALYQVIDLFSPRAGAGLAVWTADREGRYKVLALRKHVDGQSPTILDSPACPTAEEFKWKNPLAAVAGTSLAYEYLRRTRAAGETFEPAAAVLACHAGGWQAAMNRYTGWCRQTWRFRPYPSRLQAVHNMVAVGWGQSVLFKDGRYRDDFIRPMHDCIELMSWWEWSPLGPWSTPFDRVREVLGEAEYERWKSYFVTDPVTGKWMFNNQPGDYDGYNQRFGGLPALREAIERYKRSGTLVTLYTDPIRCDDATKLGQARGRQWGVKKPDGEYVKNYQVWNMCHDVAEYRQWVADAMRRVLRETGADGIRLDEYGHRGWACFSKEHAHTFAEHGTTEWQRAIAETSRLVRAAMDEVDPRSVLTTEHPGHDYLMQFLDGCITYDLTVQSNPLRPLECNLQRFYFPECKAFELDHRGADPKHRKRFWSAVGSFGSRYPESMYRVLNENADVFDARACRPLVPTLVPRVYANAFEGGGKRIVTLYNTTGHSLFGPVMKLSAPAGHHIVELLGCRDAAETAGEDIEAKAFILRDDVACLAILPKLLSLTRTKEGWRAEWPAGTGADEACIDTVQGTRLMSMNPAGQRSFSWEMKDAPGARAAVVKLLARGRLLDAAMILDK